MENKGILVGLPISQDDLVELFHDTRSGEVHQVQASRVVRLLEIVSVCELVECFAIDPHNQPAIRENSIVSLVILKQTMCRVDVAE